MSAADPTQTPGSTRPPVRPHRRVDSEAGAPEGEASEAILELPATRVDPADVGPLTGTLPGVAELPLLKNGRVVSRPGQAPGALARVFERGGPAGITVASDGVPVGPDGQPLTRRQLRELRRRQESAAGLDTTGSTDAGSSPSTPRRAEAPAGAPAGVVPAVQEPGDGAPGADGTVTRESLAREAMGLADRLEAAGDDPESVDPELLRAQELLAEKARRFNETGALATVPAAAITAGTGTAPVAAPAAEPVRHDPVQAQSAHGLDSMPASEWGSRERTLVILAAVVFAILVIALILALAL